jgi:hypothetical protein
LLPDKISQIGEYLPAAYIKKAFRIFITGRKDELETVAGGLFIWCFIIFVLTLVCIKIKENIQPKNERKNKFKERKKYHIPSLPMVVLRRFVHKKSIWICLIIITAVSVMIVTTEKSSATNIYVAFYDESGEYVQTLEDYEGLVRFVSYGSEDEVRLAVLRDEVECGYIIPQKLTESMILQMSNGMVTVYQDDDAVAVPIVNEVIFEKLFKNVSLKWYENYICKINTDIADMIDSAFEKKLNAGVVFDIDINYMGNKAQTYSGSDEAKATYPVQAAAILIVAICGIYGIIQVVSDAGKKRFYRCKKNSIYLLTILIPILFGAITGILIIAIIANIGQYSY